MKKGYWVAIISYWVAMGWWKHHLIFGCTFGTNNMCVVFWQMHLKWAIDIEICNYSWLQLLLGESVDVIFSSSFIDCFSTFIFEKQSINILCNFLMYLLWFQRCSFEFECHYSRSNVPTLPLIFTIQEAWLLGKPS